MSLKLAKGYARVDHHVEVVPLEHAEQVVDDRFATPLEQLLANEARALVLTAMKNIRAQMVFLLIEYGFSEAEISRAMKLSEKTLKNYRYRANELRANIGK